MNSDVRFDLSRESELEWVLLDRAHPAGDAESLVARIRAVEGDADEFEVTWLRKTLLPVRYLTPKAVLDDFRIWANRPDRSTRPVVIPHLPPPVKP